MLSSGPARTARRLLVKRLHQAQRLQRSAPYKQTLSTTSSVAAQYASHDSLVDATPTVREIKRSPKKSPADVNPASLNDQMLHLNSFDQRLTSAALRMRDRPIKVVPEFAQGAKSKKPLQQNSLLSDPNATNPDPVLAALSGAMRSNDSPKVESCLMKLSQFGAATKLPLQTWEAALLIIARHSTNLSRTKELISLFQQSGRMLTSKIVQAVVVQTRRMAVEELPCDLDYVEYLFDELKACRAILTFPLLMSIMQLYIELSMPERALRFGNQVILQREGFSWNESIFHLFIRAYLTVEPPAIDTALNYLRQMKALNIKPLSHSIVSIARAFLETGSPREAIQMIESHLSQCKTGSRDEMFMLAFYLRCLAVSKDDRIHEACRMFLERFPEKPPTPAYASSAMIVYHSRRGDLDKVLELLNRLEERRAEPLASVCVELIKACSTLGAAGREAMLKRINIWNSRGVNWVPLVDDSVYPELLSFFDIPPGEGPPLTPTQMAKKMENYGFSFTNPQAWVALLHYFAIVRRSDSVHEIVTAAQTKALRFRGHQLDPVFQFLLDKKQVNTCVRLLGSLRTTTDCRNICAARLVNYYAAQNEPESARALIKKQISKYGPLSISFYHQALLLASSLNNATPQQIFDVYLPLLDVNQTNYALSELLKHNFHFYFNTHQYHHAEELLQRAADELLKSSLVPTELFRMYVGISLRHLPEPNMVAEVEDLLRRLDVAPSKMGPAVVKPLLSVNIRRIMSLVEKGHAEQKTVPVIETIVDTSR